MMCVTNICIRVYLNEEKRNEEKNGDFNAFKLDGYLGW